MKMNEGCEESNNARNVSDKVNTGPLHHLFGTYLGPSLLDLMSTMHIRSSGGNARNSNSEDEDDNKSTGMSDCDVKDDMCSLSLDMPGIDDNVQMPTSTLEGGVRKFRVYPSAMDTLRGLPGGGILTFDGGMDIQSLYPVQYPWDEALEYRLLPRNTGRPSTYYPLSGLKLERITEASCGDQECGICWERLYTGDTDEYDDCFSPRGYMRVLPCSHRFHDDCLEPWIRVNQSCPDCQKTLPLSVRFNMVNWNQNSS